MMLQSLNRAIPSSDGAVRENVNGVAYLLQSLNRAIPSSDKALLIIQRERWLSCNPSIGQFRLLTCVRKWHASYAHTLQSLNRAIPSSDLVQFEDNARLLLLQSLNRAIPSSDISGKDSKHSKMEVAIPQSGNSVF